MATSQSREPSTGALRVALATRGHNIDEENAAQLLSMALFDLGAQAVGEDHGEDGLTLTAGFASLAAANDAKVLLRERHRDLVSSTTTTEVSSSVWVDNQRDSLEPTTIGRWHIRAPWHPKPNIDPLYDIVIDPGVAFGHGAHPTTRLTIELMLDHVTEETAPEMTVVDLGTGTGVAAIIAARLGATVRAVEIDTDALTVAFLNINRNSCTPFDDVSERITLISSDAADVPIEPTNLVLANVTLDVQRLLAPQLLEARLVLTSGVLRHQVQSMQDLYPARRASTIRTSGEWAAIEFS